MEDHRLVDEVVCPVHQSIITNQLMNWNILADQYCNEGQYPYAEPWVLGWDYRKQLILQEIRSIAADIVTLQEVEQGFMNMLLFGV